MTTLAIVGGVVAVAMFLVWLAFRYARKAGEAGAERDHAMTKAEQARKANEIDEDVARLSDAGLDDELRKSRR